MNTTTANTTANTATGAAASVAEDTVLEAEPVDVVIAGGGIAGLAAAHRLARIGRSVRVLEARSDLGESGFGIQLAPNATRRLDRAELLEELRARGAVQPERLVLRDAVDGRALTYLDGADIARRYGAPYLCTRRATLHDVLRGACEDMGVEILTGVTVTDVDRPDNTRATQATRATQGGVAAVAVSAHRRDPAQVVIAADGTWSRLRWPIGHHPARDTGYLAYRSLTPTHVHTRAAGAAGAGGAGGAGGADTRDMVLFIGPGRHLVQYPLDHHATINRVAVYQAGPVPGSGETGRNSGGGAEDDPPPEMLDRVFARDHPDVRDALTHIDRSRSWRIYDRDPLTHWTHPDRDRAPGRFVLIGDAAHPILQFFAQGACQCIEDAENLVTHAAANLDDWDTALDAYGAERIPRTTDIHRKVRMWGEILHADGLLRDVRNTLLRDRWAGDYRHLDWLWRH